MAMFFNGVNQYVNFGPLDVPSNTTAFTMCCFFVMFQQKDSRLISKASSTNINDHWWKLGVEGSGKLRFRLKTGGSTQERKSSTTIGLNELYWGAGVYTGNSSGLYFAKPWSQDSSLHVESFNRQSGTVSRSSKINAWIGGNPDGETSRPFPGVIFDARVYTRALTEEEAITIALGIGQDSIIEDLLWRWPLNEFFEGAALGDNNQLAVVRDLAESGTVGIPRRNAQYVSAEPNEQQSIVNKYSGPRR